ncbi:MAG: alpha/beta hydrolase [Pseudomonadota bacterium]
MSHDDHRLDPELLPVILAQRERYTNRPPMGTLPAAEMRARASAEFEIWNADPPPIARVRNFAIPATDDGPEIPVRFYDPAPGQVGGCLVYMHGGGWVAGDLDIEEAGLRHVALAGPVKLLSVDYRLAPEHPFPAAIEDGERVVRWLTESGAAELGVDPARIGLGGASAGANVALGTALRLRDRGGPSLSTLVLLYGAYGGGRQVSSQVEFGDGRFGLPQIAMEMFWRAYLGEDRTHPHAVPLLADLAGLPPTFLAKAELDVLADETDLLRERLEAAGVKVESRSYRGAMHGFTQYAKVSALARSALGDAGRAAAAGLA